MYKATYGHVQRRLAGWSPWSHKGSNTTKWLIWLLILDFLHTSYSNITLVSVYGPGIQIYTYLNSFFFKWYILYKNFKHSFWYIEQSLCVCMLSHFSLVWLFATSWTVGHQAPLSMGFSRQEYWSVALSSSRGSSQPRDWIRLS